MGILGWISQRFWFNKLGTRPRTLHFWQALRWFWDKCFANLSICLMWCLWDLLSTSNHNKKTFFCPCCLSFSDTSFSIKKNRQFENLLFIVYLCPFSYTLFLNNKMPVFFLIYFSPPSLPVRLLFPSNFLFFFFFLLLSKIYYFPN